VANAAVHEGKGDHNDALHQLRMARELGVWFQRSFGNNRKFDPGPFVPPAEPKRADAALQGELERLRAELAARQKEWEAAQRAIEEAKTTAEAEQARRLSAEERAAKAKEEVAIWEALANEQVEAQRAEARAEAGRSKALEEQNRKLRAELTSIQATARAMPPKQIELAIERASEASDAIELDEAATRTLIDHQLRDAGWEADSERLRFDRGVRPTKGRNMAIAEWPTLASGKDGRADYVLFSGLQVVAVVEAIRGNLNKIPALLVVTQRPRELTRETFASSGSPSTRRDIRRRRSRRRGVKPRTRTSPPPSSATSDSSRSARLSSLTTNE
jgi:type I restriction enzyme R subunit